jgi:hypothetical protein
MLSIGLARSKEPMRHTLCTHLREARVGLRDAMAIMRHSDPRLTLRVYTDERQISLANEVRKLQELPRNDSFVAVCSAGPLRIKECRVPAQTVVLSGEPGDAT